LLPADVFAHSAGGERIINYLSEIRVSSDAKVTVADTILVHSEADEIKHGIFRDFPTSYKDRFGNKYNVSFSVKEALLDGKRVNFWQERNGNGIRVYVGDKENTLKEGDYTYRLTYESEGQLGFFQDHDELFWNVTGNGWVFPIDKISAKVYLPDGVQAKDIRVDGFTGISGSTEKALKSVVTKNGAEFITTRALGEGEGLTIVVGWPKGFVSEPSRTVRTIRSNLSSGVMVAGFFLVLSFYVWAWAKKGRDPKKGSVIPQYEPPRNLTPAEMRYVMRFGYDKKALTSMLLHLAVKGYIKIKQEGKEYSIELLKEYQGNNKGERDTIREIFSKGQVIKLDKKDYRVFQKAENALVGELQEGFRGKYFSWNLLYFALGFFFTMILFFICAVLPPGITPLTVVMLLLIAVVHAMFIFLLRAPTVEGRRLMDEIEGFKWFLSVTEKERMNFHNPPNRTPELFERFLPYALGLGVENKWAEQFATVFAQLKEAGKPYVPAWYVGNNFNALYTANFATDLSHSLNASISAASTPPGSSSGFSGGSSGGGGGGGGGGGW